MKFVLQRLPPQPEVKEITGIALERVGLAKALIRAVDKKPPNKKAKTADGKAATADSKASAAEEKTTSSTKSDFSMIC